MKKDVLNILIGGPAGAGIEKSSKVLTLALVRAGYYVFNNVEHMSQIRGGNNFARIRVCDEFVQVHEDSADIIIALDKKTIEDHVDEVNKDGVIIFDGESVKLDAKFDSKKAKLIDAPLNKMALEIGNPLLANTIALGIIFGLTEMDLSLLKNVLGNVFGNKSAELILLNEKAAKMGYDLAIRDHSKDFPKKIKAKKSDGKMFLMGNDAVCIGAVKAGVKYVGEYPMTPSSSVLHFMAAWADKYGIVVKHTEDEIAAINSVIGAGFAGVRAMTGTSGGGFALMSEGVGLASMNEVPVVIVEVMRPGPATGQPTRTEAGDLRAIIHAGQGDPVKIVLLPGDIHECFEFGFLAFNLAEKYQLPVIIGYDKYLGEGYYTAAPFDTKNLKVNRGKLLTEKELSELFFDEYKRYAITDDGISPRAIPGMKKGIHRATSDEHNEFGEIFEEAENRKSQMDKRMKKLETALSDLPKPELIGEKNADITFVTWNSAKGACLEAVEILKEKKIHANVLQIKTAWPFHKKETTEILKKCKRPILVEQNFNGQMGGLIAENTGILIPEKILKYDGRPMTSKFIINNLKS